MLDISVNVPVSAELHGILQINVGIVCNLCQAGLTSLVIAFLDDTQLLQKLKQKEKRLFIATSKPEVFATQIIKYLHIENFFDGGVLYGYGDMEELVSAGATYIIKTPLELIDIV